MLVRQDLGRIGAQSSRRGGRPLVAKFVANRFPKLTSMLPIATVGDRASLRVYLSVSVSNGRVIL